VGRPRKSDALHRLQGTQRHESTVDPEDDSKEFTGGRLKMPPEFKEDPKRLSVWKMLFGPLQKRRTLTKADSAAAVLVVEQWLLWEVVNAEAQARPFSEVTWRDSAGHEHTKAVESAALKAAATLHRTIMQGLQQFSATPASREKTKKTKEPALKPGKVQTVAERLDEEIAALEQQTEDPVVAVDDEGVLSEIDETLADPPMTETEKLLREADAALAEEDPS
jgi:hypothetical protein